MDTRWVKLNCIKYTNLRTMISFVMYDGYIYFDSIYSGRDGRYAIGTKNFSQTGVEL